MKAKVGVVLAVVIGAAASVGDYVLLSGSLLGGSQELVALDSVTAVGDGCPSGMEAAAP